MSQIYISGIDSLPSNSNIEFVAGNDSINVPPNPTTHVINIVGDTTKGVSLSGNAGTYTETITIADSTTSQKGVVALANNPETIAGTVTTKATTPDDIKAKLGNQTLHGLPYGAGTTAAVNWLAEASNGQIPIGSTGNAPVLANITSSNGTITITNGAGTIDLSATDAIASYKNITTAMSPYTVLEGDEFLSCNSTVGPITLLFPNTTTASRNFIIKDRVGTAATNNIIITTVGGIVTIDGQTSYTFSDNFESLEMIFNGLSYEGY